MRRAAILLALLAGAVFAPAAASQHADGPPAGHDDAATAGPARTTTFTATIGFDAVRPPRLDIVAGETVKWTNESARTHTVTADDESFDSGRLPTSGTYTRRFAVVGEAPYHCSLHPTIRGVVAAHELLLDAPAQAAAPKVPFPLAGRAALAPGTPVSIEADSGAGFAQIATSEIGDDGSFAARIVPASSTTLRAVAGGVTSPPVSLVVLDRRISLSARRERGGRVHLTANVTPATRGGLAVLQLYLPERFGWWPVKQAVLGARSTASFMLHPTRRLRARVRYTLSDGATALATSRTLRIGPPPAAPRPAHHG